MKLSKRTLDVLKNFSSINPSILIKQGNVLSTIAPSKKVLANATIEESFPRTFGVYELNKLLGILSFFTDPEIEVGESALTIVGDGGKRLDFTYSSPDTIVSPPDRDLPFEPEEEFPLPAKTLQEVLKAAGVLGLPELEIRGSGGTVSIRALDSRNPSSHSFKFDLGSTGKDFRLIFHTDTFKFLPVDYTAQVTFTKLAKFSGDGLEYFVAAAVAEGK